MRDIKESDWKHLRSLHKVALERYCQRVLSDVQQCANQSSQTFHQRYLDIFQVVKQRDKLLAQLFDDPRRSTATFTIIALRRHGLLEDAEFAQFSEELRNLAAEISNISDSR
jgi:hypothetical protein